MHLIQLISISHARRQLITISHSRRLVLLQFYIALVRTRTINKPTIKQKLVLLQFLFYFYCSCAYRLQIIATDYQHCVTILPICLYVSLKGQWTYHKCVISFVNNVVNLPTFCCDTSGSIHRRHNPDDVVLMEKWTVIPRIGWSKITSQGR